MKAHFMDSTRTERRDELAEITNALDHLICRLAEYQRHGSLDADLSMRNFKMAAKFLAIEDQHLEREAYAGLMENTGDLMLEQERDNV